METEGNSGHEMGFYLDFSVITGLGEVEIFLVGYSRWTPARLCAPSFGNFKGVLVGNWDGDVLRQSHRGLVGR